jgi:hypothetical protein
MLLGSGVAVIASVGFWLSFFVRLGRELDDDELVGRAQRLRIGYALYVVALYLMWVLLNRDYRTGPVVQYEWLFEAAFAGLTAWLMKAYINVLGAAGRAIDASAARGP